MRKVRFLNLAVTLGLVVGLFAAALGTASAYGPGEAGAPGIYFPWVPNGDEADGTGPWYGTVTVQNTEIFQILVDVAPTQGTAQTGVVLKPRASKPFTAAALGIPAPGAGVKVTARWDFDNISGAALDNAGYCESETVDLVRNANPDNQTDFQTANGPITKVGKVYGPAPQPTYKEGVDYTVKTTGSQIAITWLSGGAHPQVGWVYNVNVLTDCATPRIAGVEKHATPEALPADSTTSATQVSVDGYSAVSDLDMTIATKGGHDLEDQSRWIVPIAQTHSGWNTLLYVTNVSGSSNVSAQATFYDSEKGFGDASTMILNTLLAKGETAIVDLSAKVGADKIGSIWIDSDHGVVAQVYRVKGETNMALTTLAQPRTDEDDTTMPAWFNPNRKYGALVFRNYNGWNTGINVANLSSHSNTVTINYYRDGQTVASDTLTIQPRSMKFSYLPAVANQTTVEGIITSAVIQGTEPLAAAVDEVKYMSGKDEGQAMSYAAQHDILATFPAEDFVDGRWGYISKLALPLVQKGNLQTGLGDTSGINLFNPNQNFGVNAYVQFLDWSGVPVAPTVGAHDEETPQEYRMGALSSAVIYTHNYGSMPTGFVGSAVVGVVGPNVIGDLHLPLLSSLVGVSNNVNYAVQNDGSAAFNLTPTFTFPPFDAFIPNP